MVQTTNEYHFLMYVDILLALHVFRVVVLTLILTQMCVVSVRGVAGMLSIRTVYLESIYSIHQMTHALADLSLVRRSKIGPMIFDVVQ